jgi:sporulation protein YlmC with PRC-barrel domain
MIITFKALTSLPVFTQSGIKLGHIQDIELDVDDHFIRCYIVEPKFFGKELYRIVPLQIKKITDEKIIVDDAVIKDKEREESRIPTSAPVLGGATYQPIVSVTTQAEEENEI